MCINMPFYVDKPYMFAISMQNDSYLALLQKSKCHKNV